MADSLGGVWRRGFIARNHIESDGAVANDEQLVTPAGESETLRLPGRFIGNDG